MTTGRPIGENFAAYAPAKAVLDVIKRYRERGLPEPLTLDALEQIGVSNTMTSPCLKALRFLGLIDEGGNRTEVFERLRRASTEEYPQTLAEIVRNAYLPVFSIVDPAQDGDIAIADAFRRYDPANQRNKMIRLFLGLCEEAQIIPPRTGKRRVAAQRPTPRPKPSKPIPRVTTSQSDKEEPSRTENEPDAAPDYRLISAVIQQLPRNGKWTSDKRKKWVDTMTAAVDLLFEVTNAEQPQETPQAVSQA
ncbi:MAG: DUF5343 domain-containing protein [Chloroflexi bacterium]|nr:DUF5343 domain-containing protein [Chloroflexota bacterium]